MTSEYESNMAILGLAPRALSTVLHLQMVSITSLGTLATLALVSAPLLADLPKPNCVTSTSSGIKSGRSLLIVRKHL